MSTSVPRWQRAAWLAAGGLALALGLVGIVVPLLPTVPFVLLAAWCWSRGSERWERWLLAHPRFGPPVRAWRETRSVPRSAKWMATAMMAVSAGAVAVLLDSPWRWAPAVCSTAVACWLWSLPTRS